MPDHRGLSGRSVMHLGPLPQRGRQSGLARTRQWRGASKFAFRRRLFPRLARQEPL